MSSASLIVTPWKPSSSRSSPVITARDRVAGRVASPVRAGTAMWADMASRAPAAMAARNGTSVVASSVARSASTDPEPVVGVLANRAEPRKVLDRGRHARTLEPADHGRAQARNGSRIVAERANPERRIGRFGREVQDRRVDDVDAHRSRLTADRRSPPARRDRRRRPRPSAMFPANAVVSSPSAWSWPPSWSAATSSGAAAEPPGLAAAPPAPAPARWNASVSSRTCPGDRTLWCRNTVIPATGAAARRAATQSGQRLPLEREHDPSQDRVARARLRRHPLTAPASPRTK